MSLFKVEDRPNIFNDVSNIFYLKVVNNKNIDEIVPLHCNMPRLDMAFYDRQILNQLDEWTKRLDDDVGSILNYYMCSEDCPCDYDQYMDKYNDVTEK